ncbi:TonB-dependent receptor [Flavihumibacter sp. R14]|nr:TonB-dependent receptor [Flavihumibacter soli]
MKSHLLKGLLVMVLCLPGFAGVAQVLKGKVVDSKGNQLQGVSVQVQGQALGTSTDQNGEYALKLPNEGSFQVRVSFVGYVTINETVAVGSETTIRNFTLRDADSSLDEVIIIGSRSTVPRTNVETAVPVDVISARDVKNFAQTDVTQILNYVAPSFSSNRQTVSDGTDHIDPASLRGLGPDQALVLVNGKRRHTTALVNINGTFGRGTVGTDMNSIPVAAIDRIEVLRDGAAAQYGSDAIAGVINIILKEVAPLSVSATYGQTVTEALGRNFSDGETFQVDLSKGFNLSNKGFVSFGAQYLDRGATNRGGPDTRPLLYTSLPSKGANETEEAFQARYADLKAADDARAQSEGLDRNNMRVGNSDSDNLGYFVNGEYQVGRSSQVYLNHGYTNKAGEAAGFYRLPSQASQIDVTIYPNGFLPLITTDINDVSVSAGIKGTLGQWNYDLSNTFGQNSIEFDIKNTLNASLPIGTSPTQFYAGKLRFGQNTTNLDVSTKFAFGAGSNTLNLAFGAEHRSDSYEISEGEELSYSFGQPSAGIPGRMIGTSFTAAGAQVFPGFTPANALEKSRNNTGFYLDVEGEVGPRVLLSAAGRYEDYSDFGNNFSYKFTGRVKLIDELAVRGAIASGFRAPSLHQRYFNNESTQFVQGLPTQVLTVNNDHDVVRQFGVGPLKPELSHSYSVGLAGRVAEKLTFTVDAYQINIDDRIVFSSQYTRERDASGNQIPGGTVNQILNTVDPNGVINSVQFFTNAIKTKTKGLDIVLSDRFDLGTAGRRITLTAAANFNDTKVDEVQGSDKIESDPALKAKLFDRLERSRFETSIPKNKYSITAHYGAEKFGLLVRTVRFGEVTSLNATDPSTANLPPEMDQTYSPRWITDLTVNYNIRKDINIAVGANNLFDVYPDQTYIDPRNNQDNLSGVSTTNYTGGRDNTSNGRFMYSRAVPQFGYNGRYVFGKLTFTLL